MFEEYFSRETVDSLCEAFHKRDMDAFSETITPFIEKISREKALYEDFVVSRGLNFFLADYLKFITKQKVSR
jgi:hypothetical protein